MRQECDAAAGPLIVAQRFASVGVRLDIATQGAGLMQLKLHLLYPADPDAVKPLSALPAAEPSWLGGFITMGAVGLGVLIVAGIAVLMGLVN
jgi:hypothetical protein